jgi:2-methylcitrate dehydratase PrpD
MQTTQALAAFASELNVQNISPVLKQKLTIFLLDYVRVASIGERMTWSKFAQRYIQENANLSALPDQASSVLFSHQKMDRVSATFLNTIYSGSVDADDVHVGAMLHPGCIVISSALSVGESVGASGQEILSAILAGYECMIRIGLGVQPGHFKRGFQATATCGVFGAAIAAAKLLFTQEDKELKMAQTVGLAASLCSGVTQFFHSGSTVKRMHAAQAASSGVKAALLVHAGFDGPLDGLEGVDGFMHAYSDTPNTDLITQGLGEHFETMGVSIKPHASSARVLSAIEAASKLATTSGFDASQITRIRLGIPKVILGRLTSTQVTELQAAQMSAPFCLSMALAKGLKDTEALNIDDFEFHLKDPLTQRLSGMVEIELDPEVEKSSTKESVSARVSITLAGQHEWSQYIAAPLGSAQRPYAFEDHVQSTKVELLRRFDVPKVQSIVDHIVNFEAQERPALLL